VVLSWVEIWALSMHIATSDLLLPLEELEEPISALPSGLGQVRDRRTTVRCIGLKSFNEGLVVHGVYSKV
jgi:hypothetical protein